jgi:hypothetical protein
MPGPIVHLIVQQHLESALRRLDNRPAGDLADLLRQDPCSPYAGFGSMGPDYLFFSTREYGDAIGDLVNFIFEVYDAIEPFIDFYETTIEPVKQAIEDAITALLPDDLVALINQIGDTGKLISETLITAVGATITAEVDLFYPFYPKMQQGAKESDWYWFDFLHYRRTGRFCSAMWQLADDDDLRRYVLGYASHIGTDVVGHPYVNAIVGGPYRTHWHRHKLVENWIDAYARRHYSDLQATIACLNLGPEDTYLADNIAGSYYSRLCEFPDKKLPEKLGNMIAKAMELTYHDGVAPHPPLFGHADLDSTYRLWLMWFERSTSLGQALPPAPVPPPGSAAVTLISDYASGVSSIWSGGGGGGGSGGGGFNVLAIFAAILDLLKKLFETLVYTITWIVTHAVDIVTLPITTAIEVIRYMLYQIQKAIYEIYDNARFAMVLGGYMFPDQRDLTKNPWGQAFINTTGAHLTGGGFASFINYPRKRQNYQLFGATSLHLLYPLTLLEQPFAEPAPLPFFGANPETFISGSFPINPVAELLPDCKKPYGAPGDYSATHSVDMDSWATGQLGNALSFSARLMAQRLDDMPNFNLDGDRGYGFKTWRVEGVDPEADPTMPPQIEINPVNVAYID